MEKILTIHTDGGSRGNPGPSACAFVAETDGREIQKQSKFLGVQTNNFAEYSGILLALQWVAKQLTIVLCSDSELVVKQLNGIYKIKNQILKNLNEEIIKIIKVNNLHVVFKNVPR